MKKWVIMAALFGLYLLLCLKVALYISECHNKTVEAQCTLNISGYGYRGNPQDSLCGWCSLMPQCAKRCVCHDECGPWCMLWRKLVYNGVIKDNGVHKLSTEKVLKYKNLRDSIVFINKIHPNKESN